jgi:putative membrane protein
MRLFGGVYWVIPMGIDERTLAHVNLILQAVLVLALLVAAYIAKVKRNFARHCLVLRITAPLQIVAVIFVMSASLARYLQVPNFGFLQAELLIHHTLGVIVIALWVFVNLVFQGIVKFRGRLAILMRIAFTAWALSLAIGLHIYSVIWT